MNYKKRILALILFGVLLICSGYRIYHILGYQDNVHSKAVFAQFYDLPNDTIDVVWIGPSSVQEYINAALMYEETGLALYPFAVGNMPFNSTEYIIIECEKTQDPEIYLVDIRDLAYNVLSETTIRRTTDNMKFSINRFNAIDGMIDDLRRFYPDSEISLFDYYFSFTKYHTRWSELKKTDFTDDDDSYLGYWIATQITAFDKEEVLSRLNAEPCEIPEEDEYFLNDFLDFCDTFDKQVIFTCTPICLDEEKFGQYNYIKKVIEERGYEIWDLNYDVDAIGLDYLVDFKNDMHTNVWGAQKVSAYVSRELMKRFSFVDHRDDKNYSKYVEAFDRYQIKMDEL